MNKGHSVPVPDYVAVGFQKIDCDLSFLIECLAEVLDELGLGQLTVGLPWFGSGSPKVDQFEIPSQLGLVYSIRDR